MFGLLAGLGSLVGGVAKSISGGKRERAARDAINAYQRQDLVNAFDDIGVSRLGADLQREENARIAATNVDALRSAGPRGLAMLGQIQRNNNLLNREIASDLDRQRQRIDILGARDDVRIRNTQEQREREDLAGLGTELNAGRQDKFGGMGDIAQGLGGLAFLDSGQGGGLFNLPNIFGGGGAPSMATPGYSNMGNLTPNAAPTVGQVEY